jgi:hypothetical protein
LAKSSDSAKKRSDKGGIGRPQMALFDEAGAKGGKPVPTIAPAPQAAEPAPDLSPAEY